VIRRQPSSAPPRKPPSAARVLPPRLWVRPSSKYGSALRRRLPAPRAPSKTCAPSQSPASRRKPGEAEQRRQVLRRKCERQLKTVGGILKMASFPVRLRLPRSSASTYIVPRRHVRARSWRAPPSLRPARARQLKPVRANLRRLQPRPVAPWSTRNMACRSPAPFLPHTRSRGIRRSISSPPSV